MIFAEIQHEKHYKTFHPELVALMLEHFTDVTSGLQPDSWIWVRDNEELVKIDTFTSKNHQVKSPMAGALIRKVIDVLKLRFQVKMFDPIELEEHEHE